MERLRSSPAIGLRFIVAMVAAAGLSTAFAAETKAKAIAAVSENDRVQRFLEDRVRADPDDIIAQNRLAEIYLQRLRETADNHWLERAAEAAARSLASVPAEQNTTGLFMQARVEYDSHHFVAARDRAALLTRIEPNKSRGWALLGDALLEFGDADEAAHAYAEMQKRKGDSIETEPRLARMDLARGVYDGARMHYEKALQAARDLSPPSSEIIAWCLVQSGQLAFNTGQWDAAEKNYQAALVESPGDIAALEHLGELRAAQAKYDEAIALYEKVIARRPRPEFCQALGDVYAAMGQLTNAGAWHARAREAYLKDAADGNAHYFHHLAGFFADTEENPAEALKWARRDLELRHTAAAQDALAWALYRRGELGAAEETASKILAGGSKDAHILAHGGMIFLASGNSIRGKEILAEAARVNPRHNLFHVHR